MTLEIHPDRSLSDIKSEFNTWFPFLKLEFFKVAHEASEPTQQKAMISADMTIGKIGGNKQYGTFQLSPATTVSALEAAFRDEYGLNVQVFRKSGNVWLETTITDNLTLQTQNALGHEKSHAAPQPDVSDFDYD